MIKSKYYTINLAFTRSAERLNDLLIYFPFALLFPLGIGLLLTAHIMSGVNYRAGNPSNPIDYHTPPISGVPLWLSVTPINDDIVVTTSQGEIFMWPQELHDLSKLQPLTAYLRQKSKLEIQSAALLNRREQNRHLVVISADRQVTFAHLKPIIFAMADAGISNYALETKLTEVGEL